MQTPTHTERSPLADVGQRAEVPISRAQKVWIDRAAAALDELGVSHAHSRAAMELRYLVREWNDAWTEDDEEEQSS